MDTTDKNPTFNLTDFIKEIGNNLIESYGEKQFYFPNQVATAHENSSWKENLDLANIAMATFCTFSNFESFHRDTDKSMDYGALRDAVFLTLSETLSAQEIKKFSLPIELGNYPKNIKNDLDDLSDVLYHISDLFD